MFPASPRIVVIGTGYVGLPAALMWAKAGLPVVGVDINENIVKAINDRTLLLSEKELHELLHDPMVKKNLEASVVPREGDVFVIAVPTPVHPLKKIADLSYVKEAIKSITPFLKKGNLIIIESTIPPLTTREFAKSLVEELTDFKVPQDIYLAHCPERILPGDIFKEIVWNDRLIGGVDAASADYAAHAYSFFVKGNLFKTGDVEAELSKLMENTYRDVNIALANEFSLICEDLGVDVKEVIGYANKHPRVKILSPGIGVGGHCIPVDPWFLKEVAPYNSRIITMARLVNDEMPHRVANKIRKMTNNVSNPKIVAVGATYKKNCEDMRESPATEIIHLLKQDGYDIHHYDPLVEGMTYRSLSEICKGADLLVVLVAHDVTLKEINDKRRDIEAVMNNKQIAILDN
jgi:UDP-N-acetyl-D-mannosaminuronic acid dehydrogenase